MDYIIKCLKQYADFSGRARRSEYWTFFLAYTVVYFIIDSVLGLSFVAYIYALLLILPILAVSARRMHDIGKSGWWILIQIVPIVGNIIFIALSLFDSKPGDNQYGPNPKGVNVM